MKIRMIEVSKLRLDENNARKRTTRNLDAIKASLARFGQQRPILVDENLTVRAGNGTLLAAIELGIPRLACITSSLSDDDIRAYAIADNRTAELSEWNIDALNSYFSENGFDDIASLGFNDADIAALLGDGEPVAAIDADKELSSIIPFSNPKASDVFRSVVVHFPNSEAVEAFKSALGITFSDSAKYSWFPPQENDSYMDEQWVGEGEGEDK